MNLRWQDVRLVYLREVRAALRERGIVVNSILIPLLMYPVLLWLMFLALTFAKGQEERFVSRIAWVGETRPESLHLNPEGDGKSADGKLADGKSADGKSADGKSAATVEWVASPGEAEAVESAGREAIRRGDLDLLVLAAPDPTIAGNLQLRLFYDTSKERSAKAYERLVGAVEGYRGRELEAEAGRRALPPDRWQQVHLQRENVSSEKEMGAFILGMIAPMVMVIMMAVGIFYPAVDAMAGERERSTWETTFTTAASRASILFGKYLYVSTFGLLAGMLNLLAMAISMPMVLAPLLQGDDKKLSFAVPWSSLPLMLVAAALLALALAAAMMVLAAFARTFKEGQSMVGPVYLGSILPTVLVSSPDLQLTAGWALVPIANLVLLFRDAITGVYNWPLIALTLLVQGLLVVLCLFLARQVLRFEEVMVGNYGGNFQKFLKDKLVRSRRTGQEPGA